MRSDSPPSDTLIFSPASNSPITFVRKIVAPDVKELSGKLVVSLKTKPVAPEVTPVT